jgi:class 3 adenylate cyclase
VKALTQSMTTKVMVSLVRQIIQDYDLFERTGIPRSVAIPNVTAAQQVVKDVIAAESFLDFVLLLIKTSDHGYMGRRYAIPYLRPLINGVIDLGYIYDSVNDIFVENSHLRRTRNWGTLKTGETYMFAFLRIDVAGNSELVRNSDPGQVDRCYDELRQIVNLSVQKRNGRIWGWDGDGGLAAFFYGNKNRSAVLAAMEILHELFLYNHLKNPLDYPIVVRIAVHNGPFVYSPDPEDLKTSDTVKQVEEIEHMHTEPGSLSISEVVQMMLGPMELAQLTEKRALGARRFFVYSVKERKNGKRK